MPTPITVTGMVATTPRHLVTQDGLSITSFRLASSQPKFDHEQGRWVDGETNWYTITSFKDLAINLAGSVLKGHRVIVSGDLRVRDWDNGEHAGTSIEIHADSIGHDLAWGSAVFTRTVMTQNNSKYDNTNAGEVAGLKKELRDLREAIAGLLEDEED